MTDLSQLAILEMKKRGEDHAREQSKAAEKPVRKPKKSSSKIVSDSEESQETQSE